MNHRASEMSTRLLIIDDDDELTRLLRELLAQEGFEVDTSSGGADGQTLATSGGYSLVILDVMLPTLSGFDILKEIRRTCAVPIILLTARGADIDRIVGLEIGADDYVPKPFNARELSARIRAVLRRSGSRGEARERHVLSVDDVTLDPASRAVVRDGVPVDFTAVEFNILRLLIESAGHVVSRERISQEGLTRSFESLDRSVDMHISKLRRKLGLRGNGQERIRTIRGIGYIYTLPSDR